MIFVGTEALRQQKRRALRLPNGVEYMRGEYMESPRELPLLPQSFLVEQPANSTILSHFHRQNQFQVVVGGSGSIGRHALQPVSVHYAGAYTGYGPLLAGPEGLDYMTLRPQYDPGANFLPEARATLAQGPKRHWTSDALQPMAAGTLRALAEVRVTEVLALQDDGLAVIRYALPPSAVCPTLAPAGSAGQFLLVIAGALEHGGALLGVRENLFISADEPAYALQAGAAGAEVLLLRYPLRDPAYAAN